MTQFNGFCGCPFCLSSGETVKTSDKGRTHAYPFNSSNISGHGVGRTHADTIRHAKKADESLVVAGKPKLEYGIKGTTWFMFLPHFNIIKGMALDYMHCVLLGIMKMLLHLRFDKAHRAEGFSIASRVKDVDKRLSLIKPPAFISRIPRSLEDILRHLS